MTTDIALHTDATDLTAFVWQASKVYEIAKGLAETSFVPVSMRGKPQEITAAILFGRELNMGPMTSLRTIDVIQGRPTLSANAMRGLAMAAGVKFRLVETTATRCVMSAVAPGSSEWTTVTWTLDQAKQLGLTTKDNWRNQPGVMLIARATSQLCRLVAANILIGATYSTEEIRDLETPVPGKVRPNLKPVSPAPKYNEPELTPDNEATYYGKNDNAPPKEIGYDTRDDGRKHPEPPVDRDGKITAKTRAAIMAGFNEAGKDRTARNETISKVLGREVHTVNNLTEAEGQSVLGVLALDPQWPPVAGAEGQA